MSSFLETYAGQKIYRYIQSAPENQRDSLMQVADDRFPGIMDEILLYVDIPALDPESLLKGFGTPLAVAPSDVVNLRSEIASTRKSIADLQKTGIDEHLAVIESMSGIQLGEDRVLKFMLKAAKRFGDSIADEDSGRKKRLNERFYKSFDRLWPRNSYRKEIRTDWAINDTLEALRSLNTLLQEQEQYYGGYFTDDEAMGVYEDILFGE